MTRILTESFKQLCSDKLKDSIVDITENCTYHLVGAKSDAFEGAIPTPKESIYETVFQPFDEMLFGKKINSADVNHMIRNIPWESGKVFDIYDDKDPSIATKDFYAVSDQEDGSYSVFKCIYKPLTDTPSIYKPLLAQTDPSDEIYITGDGYHWKYMFSISSIQYSKFANSNYVPVYLETAVQNAAVPGTIDAILIENAGAEYNNYAFGRVKQANYDNNTLKVSIQTDDVLTVKTYDITYTSNGTFTEGDTVSIDVPGANIVTADVYKISVSGISFTVTANTETITNTTITNANGTITLTGGSVTADVNSIRDENLPNLSSSTNFYKDAVFYIRGGTGAGQIKDIVAYDILGNDRVVTLDSAFDSPIDSVSTFSILPKINITGDGTGAIALAEVETAANSISQVEIINRGSGYTSAFASVSGNNGIIDINGNPVLSNEAELRPIISPIDGHGANATVELFGSTIGISTDFANSEVNDYTSYSKIALVKDLLFNGVEVTLNSLTDGDFAVGETVYQENLVASGKIDAIDANTNVLTLANVLGTFEASANNLLIGSNTNVAITTVSNNDEAFNADTVLTISPISLSYTAGETITQTNSNATAKVIKASPTVINISNIQGSFTTNPNDIVTGEESGATSIVMEVGGRNIVDNSGKVIYIENIAELQRSSSTTENIKLIIKF